MVMKAMVTGGGGFLGKALTRLLLAEGHATRVFELPLVNTASLAELGAEVISGDLRDPQAVEKACQGMEVVFHVASLASPWGPGRLFDAINVTGAENVIAACRREKVPRLVYTSSPSAIFDGTDQRGLDESVPYPTRFTSHYGRTKALAEQKVLAAHGPDLATTAIRPHVIWGPGDNHLFPRLLKRALAGKLQIIGTGRNLIDVTHVEDAARAHLLAAQSQRPAGKAYFVSQGRPVSLWGLVGTILEKVGIEPPRRKVPYPVAKAAALLIEIVWAAGRLKGEPPFTRYIVDELARDHYYNISRARADLGFEPRVTTESGQQSFVDWIKNELLPKLEPAGQ
jgi:nucleoside-diphosphate-sugar epimerase